MSIQLVVTGGTIDKDYNTLTGELVFDETHLPKMLKQANCTLTIDLQTLMLKDSLEMTDADRDAILQACINSQYQKLVITHGTDTMIDSALHLADDERLADKTIVLTGAMRPFQLGRTDALFNLGSALMACQLSSAGVYIAMNGDLFSPHHLVKNRKLGVFETQA